MNCQDRVFPSWNRRGGCASKKKARSLRSGADGVVIMVNVDVVTLSRTDHPVCAFIRRLRSIFLMAQPPLLSEEGNALSLQFIHTFAARHSRNQKGTHRRDAEKFYKSSGGMLPRIAAAPQDQVRGV